MPIYSAHRACALRCGCVGDLVVSFAKFCCVLFCFCVACGVVSLLHRLLNFVCVMGCVCGLVCLFVVAVGVDVGMVVVVGAILRENCNDVCCWSVFLSVCVQCFEVIFIFRVHHPSCRQRRIVGVAVLQRRCAAMECFHKIAVKTC